MPDFTLSIPHAQRPFSGDDVLAYYDGPLLFWLPVPGRRLLVVMLADEETRMPALVVELSEEQACAMLANQVTMRAVVLAAQAAWYMADYGADTLVMTAVDHIPDEWLPGDVTLFLKDAS